MQEGFDDGIKYFGIVEEDGETLFKPLFCLFHSPRLISSDQDIKRIRILNIVSFALLLCSFVFVVLTYFYESHYKVYTGIGDIIYIVAFVFYFLMTRWIVKFLPKRGSSCFDDWVQKTAENISVFILYAGIVILLAIMGILLWHDIKLFEHSSFLPGSVMEILWIFIFFGFLIYAISRMITQKSRK